MRQLTHKFALENQSFCYIHADYCVYADKTICMFLLLIYIYIKKKKIVIIKEKTILRLNLIQLHDSKYNSVNILVNFMPVAAMLAVI